MNKRALCKVARGRRQRGCWISANVASRRRKGRCGIAADSEHVSGGRRQRGCWISANVAGRRWKGRCGIAADSRLSDRDCGLGRGGAWGCVSACKRNQKGGGDGNGTKG